MIDSGPSQNLMNDQSLFQNTHPGDNVTIELADGSSADAVARQTVLAELQNASLLLRNVYLVPSLKSNILSCSMIDHRGVTIQTSCNNCTFYERKARYQMVGTASLIEKDGL